MGVSPDDGDAGRYRLISLVLRTELPGGRDHNMSLAMDVDPDRVNRAGQFTTASRSSIMSSATRMEVTTARSGSRSTSVT
jgi:hypothetical protein